MKGPITAFAKGARIPLTYDQFNYGHPPQEPDSLTGLDFIFTVVRSYDRSEVLRLTRGVGITAALVDGKVVVTLEIDTNSADWSPLVRYEYDFWVIDDARGPHRLESSWIQLDEPETINLTI